MVAHTVNFGYLMPEWASLDIDMDADIDLSEKEAIALAEIKEVYPEVENIEIESIVLA